ncbi:Hypothetical protein I595_1234 [Croceitalea dokdonensis DOKDO 023]|uniref:MtN3 and saliva related transmembrane protein n=1 Tax=Croceitalea dokdonensis DOKDO 023 TaxID=1300341 RepID=A0A0P7B1B5_9FLAO|nr:SemiSWEET transporter [Croceitalea dokdonensis]KPM32807.1 Hypothetical protein I595_1234 [Croceitalea dokdonensis DOKDO 023]
MENVELVGLAAAVLTTSAFVPQVYKAWKHRSTKDISLLMYLVFVVGVLLWLFYGIAIDSISIIAANVVTLLLAIAIIVAKLRFK